MGFFHGLDRRVYMKISRQTYIEDIQLLIGKHRIQIGIMPLIGVLLHHFRAHIANGHQIGIFHGIPSGDMGPADAANANQTNF